MNILKKYNNHWLVLFIFVALILLGLITLFSITRINGDEYRPNERLYTAILLFGWALLTIVGIIASLIILRRTSSRLSIPIRLLIGASYVIFALALVAALWLAIWNLKDYVDGHVAYSNAFKKCGHSPLLGESFGQTYISPGSKEYERLKYSVGETHFGFGPDRYFCSEDEAISKGYSTDPFQDL